MMIMLGVTRGKGSCAVVTASAKEGGTMAMGYVVGCRLERQSAEIRVVGR